MTRREIGGGEYVKWEKEGQEVAGEWRGFRPGRKAPDGKETVVGVVETEAGEVKFPATRVLQTKLGIVAEGISVWITYLGTRKGAAGTSYKNFRVEVEE